MPTIDTDSTDGTVRRRSDHLMLEALRPFRRVFHQPGAHAHQRDVRGFVVAAGRAPACAPAASSAAVASMATAIAACAPSSQRPVDHRAEVDRDRAGRAPGRRTARIAGSEAEQQPGHDRRDQRCAAIAGRLAEVVGQRVSFVVQREEQPRERTDEQAREQEPADAAGDAPAATTP